MGSDIPFLEHAMDPGDLLLLDAIIKEGSITGAARKLGEPKATISRRLQRLEKAAGASLFDRTSRRLRPTPLGQGLSGPAADIRRALAGAQSIADATRSGDGGSLRIASPFLFGRMVLAPFVGRFLGGHANASVALKFTNEPVDPLRDDIDLAIQVTEPKAAYLVRTKLTTADLKLYAAPHIAKSIMRASDLKKHKAIKTSNEVAADLILRLSDGQRTWEERLGVKCTVNDPEAACYVASRGTAIAALPEFLAQRFVAMGELLPVLPNVRAGNVDIFAVTPPGRLAVPLVRSFMTALKEELKETRFAK
jgi:DNA-binding transcriptional LysR family regulator